jgi:hypothetical protein
LVTHQFQILAETGNQASYAGSKCV